MAGEWRTIPLEECLDALIDYRGISPPKSPNGIPVISAKVIKGGRIQTPIEQRISEDDYTWWMRRGSPEPGDVILTTEGPLGEAAILDASRYAPGQRVVFLRGRSKEVVSRYLFYFLRSSFGQAELKQRATGTTVEGISQAALRRVPVRLPSLQQQNAIADLLGSLDEKIELNQRMAQTLETMARALFKSWFVDFDPVRARAEGLPITLSNDLAALFPDRFGENGLPRGWRRLRLGEEIELAYGKSLPSDKRRPGTVQVYGSNGQVGVHDIALVKGPGIVVGRKGNPGVVTYVPTSFFPIDTTFYVVPRRGAPISYLWFLLENAGLEARGADSAVPGLNREAAYAAEVAAPPVEITRAFDRLSSPFIARTDAAKHESQALAALRDTLLPKLISGELRIADAEKKVSAA